MFCHLIFYYPRNLQLRAANNLAAATIFYGTLVYLRLRDFTNDSKDFLINLYRINCSWKNKSAGNWSLS